jgi:quercetin dioxygenase-like cupin family protein
MKKFLFSPLLLIFFCQVAFTQTNSGSMQNDTTHIMVNNNDMKWMDGPPVLPPGIKMTVLNGDPSKEGEFAIRIMMPANYKVPPHWHPTTENVTVLEGTLYMGSSEKFDEKNSMALSQGGYSSIPAHHPHFVFTKDKAVVQVHAMGPFSITYINPADDPQHK